ncbi:MAG: hypothetical protein M0Z50_13260, partial [Planctomycetia bacterium]|nr:hypothetical protein [Planctomycetia bacterium]
LETSMHKATTPPGNPLPRTTFFIGLFRPHAAEDSVFYRRQYKLSIKHHKFKRQERSIIIFM